MDGGCRGHFFLWEVGRLMMVDLGLFFRREERCSRPDGGHLEASQLVCFLPALSDFQPGFSKSYSPLSTILEGNEPKGRKKGHR